ncbi:FadR/GntR family transcriptional regulator [Pseudonocardia sp. GCM10023141]|uniref:FadR/GntR family transcriptional regulator n=1 Tax=Pseudonocardia sp. GCM10023141 TaxID=3252653 RepID=UPI0036136C7C
MATTGGAESFPTLQMPKAASLAAASVRRRIVRGELKEGDALPPESELMKQFGISRPTLREALRILEAEGLLVVRRGARGGARVTSPDPAVVATYAGLLLEFNRTEVSDVLSAQAVLEVGAVQRLAEHGSRDAIARLEGLLDEEEAALGDTEKFSAVAATFHAALIELCGSQTLAMMGGMLSKIIFTHGHVVAAVQPPTPGRPPAWQTKSNEVHRALLEHIKARDADAGVKLWTAHCRANRRATLAEVPNNTVLDLFD